MQQNNTAAAIAHYEEILLQQPGNAEIHHQLGILYRSAGDLAEAERYLRESTRLEADRSDYWNDLGTILKNRDKMEDALAAYDRSLEINPQLAEALYNSANVLVELKREKEALRRYREALHLKPDFAFACHKVGNIYRKREDFEESLEWYQKAIDLKSDFVQPIFSKGLSLQALGRHMEAAKQFDRAMQMAPHLPKPYVALSNMYFELGEYNAALEFSRRAIKVRPDFAPAWARLADVLAFQGNTAEAAQAFERALQHDPDHAQSRYTLCFVRAMLGDWTKRQEDIDTFATLAARYVEGDLDDTSVSPLHLNYFPVAMSMHRTVAEKHAARISKGVAGLKKRMGFTFVRTSKPRLKIGYLSPDFRTHAVNTILHDMYRHHDRESFEIYAYSTVKPESNNKYRDAVIDGVDVFVDAHPLSHEATADRIYSDCIDILVDLGGYTTHARPEIMALRPAATQVQYLGYLDTMGADFIDYVLGDNICLPDELKPHYTEKFVRLPHAVGCSPIDIAAKESTRADFDLPEDAFVFCCFNAIYKIDPEVFDAWMTILKALPGSVLWLHDQTAQKVISANLRREAEARGVDAKRLIFAEKIALSEHNARFRHADLFLDTFAFAAGATAVGALQGVPILARTGATYASRISASMLTAVQLDDMICDSTEAYIARALELAQNPAALADVGSRLAEGRTNGALYDLPRFVGSLEQAYREMWRRFERGEAPDHISIA